MPVISRNFMWTLDALYGVAERVLQNTSNQLEMHVCASALRFMCQILCWEFHGSLGNVIAKSRASAFSTSYDYSNGKRGGDAGTFVQVSICLSIEAFMNVQVVSICIFLYVNQPGPAWQEVLLSPNHTNWLLHFYSCIRQQTSESSWMDSPLCVSARQLILQLCCLSGSIFPPGKHIRI